MKTGVIIYITGDESSETLSDAGTVAEKLNIRADRVEIISQDTGHFDIQDAWRSLVTKGMQHVVCKLAKFSAKGDIQLTGHELRLCG